ncbi:hypothetical protein [Pandoraea apista]|uniref:hypothetical protein n=1 Tax=Pandoraea apista TaxID=93218 RepID=UPI0039BF064A
MLWLGPFANLQGSFITISDALIGACLGYLSIGILHVAYRRLTWREGLGSGDVNCLPPPAHGSAGAGGQSLLRQRHGTRVSERTCVRGRRYHLRH